MYRAHPPETFSGRSWVETMVNRKRSEDVSKDRLRKKIEDDTRTFLESGGEITVVPTGQSGVDLMKPGQKHIKLGTSK